MTTKNQIDWLIETRGLDAALLDFMGVRQTQHPSLGAAIAFPYRRNGEPYAAKFRTDDKRFLSTAGVSRGLFNEDALRNVAGARLIICEGEIDCLSIMQAGFDCVVSVPDGWSDKGEPGRAIVDEEARIAVADEIIVAGDMDEAGASLPRYVSNLFPQMKVRAVRWPEGCKDANDVLMAHGEAEIVSAIEAARMVDPEGGSITGLSDLPPMGHRWVLKAGNELLDRRVALEVGAMSVITGIPGHGKSTFTTWLADCVTRNEEVRCGLLSFETHPFRTRDQLARLNTGRPWSSLPQPARQELLKDLDRRFRLVHIDNLADIDQTIGWLEQTVTTLAVRDHCKLIIIDPWNELEHLPQPGESLTNYINWALKRIRQLAAKLEVHIVLVAHPKKIDGDRAPGGYDVADSAAFANKPALGVTIHTAHTDTGAPYTQIVTWKVRDTHHYGIHKGLSCAGFNDAEMSYFSADFVE